jgi:putative zinc finger/helix-turn-helix YgiT family protein
MATVNCPECKKGVLTERNGEYETVYRDRSDRSHRLKVPGVAWLECDACGEAVLDDRAMSIVEAARRKALRLLSPQEIRAFRMSLRKTQGAMSALLGIGEKTYTRWESGAFMQSEAFDRYLRLLRDDDENVLKLQEIANGKEVSEAAGMAVGARAVFDHIEDVPRVEERGRLFVELMTRGALYTV